MKRDQFILIRVSEKEKEKIQDFAEAKEVSVSAAIRDYINKVRTGEIKNIARFTIYEPGEYALIKSKTNIPIEENPHDSKRRD